MIEIVLRGLTKKGVPSAVSNHDVHYTNDRRPVRFHVVIIRGGESGVKLSLNADYSRHANSGNKI